MELTFWWKRGEKTCTPSWNEIILLSDKKIGKAGWSEGSDIVLGRIFFMRANDQKGHGCGNLNKSIPEERTACSKVLRQEGTRRKYG